MTSHSIVRLASIKLLLVGTILCLNSCKCGIPNLIIYESTYSVINQTDKRINVEISPNFYCPCEILPGDTVQIFSKDESCGDDTPPSSIFHYLQIAVNDTVRIRLDRPLDNGLWDRGEYYIGYDYYYSVQPSDIN